jgi:hypothetical protein
VRYEDLTAVKMMVGMFWVLTTLDCSVDTSVWEKHTASMFNPKDGSIMFF